MYIILFLIIKHFVVDFFLQYWFPKPYKSIYLHSDGLYHALYHGIGTFVCFVIFNPAIAVGLGIVDSVVHYHIDWCKSNIIKKFQWNRNHIQLWLLIMLDQLLHILTYFILVDTFQRLI